MLIRNFGHFWERKYINYGRGRHPGHLCGSMTKTRKADFREQIGIYILFDKDFTPVYIGQAGSGKNRLLSRLNQHENDHLWNRWDHFSWFGVRRVNKNGTLSKFDDITKVFKVNGSLLLNQIEGSLITALEPKLNRQGASWKGVEEYFQQVDAEMEELQLRDVIRAQQALRDEIRTLGDKLGA